MFGRRMVILLALCDLDDFPKLSCLTCANKDECSHPSSNVYERPSYIVALVLFVVFYIWLMNQNVIESFFSFFFFFFG